MTEQKKKNLAIFEVLLCAALWSIAGILMKSIPWNSFVIAGFRSALAGTVAFIYLRARGMRFVMNRRSLAAGAALSLTMLLFCLSNKLTTAANAIVLQFTSPVFIMLISSKFLHKKYSRADVITVIITLLGISLFFLDSLGGGGMLGNVTALASGVTFACYYITLGQSPENERLSGIVIANAITFIIGIPFILITRPELTGTPLLLILILGVFQLGIPYVLLAHGSGYCPPLACSLMGALEPLLNPVWVLLFNGETPGAYAIAGGVIVIVTISAWCVYSDKKSKAEARST